MFARDGGLPEEPEFLPEDMDFSLDRQETAEQDRKDPMWATENPASMDWFMSEE